MYLYMSLPVPKCPQCNSAENVTKSENMWYCSSCECVFRTYGTGGAYRKAHKSPFTYGIIAKKIKLAYIEKKQKIKKKAGYRSSNKLKKNNNNTRYGNP